MKIGERVRRRRGSLARREALQFYIFASPFIIGLIVFTIAPFTASLILSFTNYSIISAPKFIGLDNYETLLHDIDFYQSLKVSATYTGMYVPLLVVCGLSVALLLNQKVVGLAFFRTLFYLPSVMSGVAVSILFTWILNPSFGIVNILLEKMGIPGPLWISSEKWALPSMVILSIWQMGPWVVIYLAALQNVPAELYDASVIDGAGVWNKFRHITLPMISPIVFFNVITGLIYSLQFFTPAWLMTRGGPNKATWFYVLNVFFNAFRSLRMGYASAQAWILFLIIMSLTLVIFKSAGRLVYYEAAQRRQK